MKTLIKFCLLLPFLILNPDNGSAKVKPRADIDDSEPMILKVEKMKLQHLYNKIRKTESDIEMEMFLNSHK